MPTYVGIFFPSTPNSIINDSFHWPVTLYSSSSCKLVDSIHSTSHFILHTDTKCPILEQKHFALRWGTWQVNGEIHICSMTKGLFSDRGVYFHFLFLSTDDFLPSCSLDLATLRPLPTASCQMAKWVVSFECPTASSIADIMVHVLSHVSSLPSSTVRSLQHMASFCIPPTSWSWKVLLRNVPKLHVWAFWLDSEVFHWLVVLLNMLMEGISLGYHWAAWQIVFVQQFFHFII